MKYILSASGRDDAAAALRAPFVVGLDFDGTLAPIVTDPKAVEIDPALRGLVDDLALHCPVAIVTGRSIADVRSRTRLHRVAYYGNHGLEGGPGWPAQAAEYRRLTAHWHTLVEHTIGSGLERHRIAIENKEYSLALHFRRSRDREAAVEAIHAAIAALDPAPRVVPGKAVVNLVPMQAPTKGDALRLFAATHGRGTAVFVGDDATDEDAFKVAGLDVVGVRVGGAAESGARYCLRGQTEVRALLEMLDGLAREGATDPEPAPAAARQP
jgi:trehalose 6-phosphate phosphatase